MNALLLLFYPISSNGYRQLSYCGVMAGRRFSKTLSLTPSAISGYDQPDLENIVRQTVTWSGINGLMYTDGNLGWSHAPVSLVPNTFPKQAFDYAQEVAPIFNVLVDKVSRDKDFLVSNLGNVAENDNFVSRLLQIYTNLPDEIILNSIHLGLHRSDYMVDESSNEDVLLQVELNTIASSFGCLSKKV